MDLRAEALSAATLPRSTPRTAGRILAPEDLPWPPKRAANDHPERGIVVAGIAVITEACIDVKDRSCVDVCPVQCIYELNASTNVLFSEMVHGNGVVENSHRADPAAIAIFGDSILYVNPDECTSCTACYEPDVCPVGAIYSEDRVPDGVRSTTYNKNDPNKGHDHRFFIQHSHDVFAD